MNLIGRAPKFAVSKVAPVEIIGMRQSGYILGTAATGTGLSSATSTASICGTPTPNNLPQVVSQVLDGAPWNLLDARSIFDVPTLFEARGIHGSYINHELVCALLNVNNVSIAVTLENRWYRNRDNKLLFSFKNDFVAPPLGYAYPALGLASWIGYKAGEIDEAGDYRVEFWVNGSLVKMQNFTVTGIPAKEYDFNFNVSIQPQSGTMRTAKAGECEVRVQYPWGVSQWTDFAVAQTDTSGNATITVKLTDMRVSSSYRVTAKHIASGAEIASTFNIDANGMVGPLGTPVVINTGISMPATFQQARSARGYSLPEARPWSAGLRAPLGLRMSVRRMRP